MTTVNSVQSLPSSPPVPQPAASPATVAAPATAADRVGTSSEADAIHLQRWLDEINPQIQGATPAQLKGWLTQLEGWQRKALPDPARARVELGFSAVQGQLTSLGVDRMSNGKSAFKHLQAAFDLAPRDPAMATSYGRTLQAFTQQSGIARAFIQSGLGIDLKKETRRAASRLAPLTTDPIAMLLVQRLSTFGGDKAARAAADAALAQLNQHDPAGVTRALRELDGDAARAPEDAKK